jgi:competence protein ComEC
MQWTEARSFVPILCVLAVLGAGVYSLVAVPLKIHALEAAVGKPVTIEGIVVRDADKREKTTYLTLEVKIPDGGKTRTLLFADTFTRVSYGDRIRATGILENPERFETDSGRTFNYPKYLLAHKVTYTMSLPEIMIIGSGRGNKVIASLLSLKHAFITGIERALPEPESALLAGLLLGEKQSLGAKITDAFRNAGVVHIIVLSGYNVALVIEWMAFLFIRIFPRKVAYAATALFVMAFALMTGGSETTIRAVLMALFMMLATVLHRPKAALRGLLIAAAIMALWNPYIVLYDLSFQLSVLATLGLILLSGHVAERLSFMPDWKYLPFREIVSTTLATQVVVLPFLILSIGTMSLVFLPANVLVLPAVPVAMFVGFFASLTALLSPVFALPVSILAYAVLHYIIAVAVWLGELPFASFLIPSEWMWASLAALAACYAFAVWLLFRFRQKIFLIKQSK